MKLILASASERRHELLKRIVPDFEISISSFNEEEVEFNGDDAEYVKEISKGKALDVKSRLKQNEDAIIIACDTIVSFNGNALGKPKDEMDAFLMLSMLSGSVHQVYSGLTVMNTVTNELVCHSVCTNVKFSELSAEDIKKYIATGEPMDKAGAYGIQGYGGVFVEGIEGDFYNVVGLPLNKLNSILREMGVNQ